MKPFLLTCIFIASVFCSSAQYCTPSVSTGTVSINYIGLGYSTWIAGGVNYSTGNSGYTYQSASSGTLRRYIGASFYYNINNSGGTAKSVVFRLYADWNQDGDFDDEHELQFTVNTTLGAATTFGTGNNITCPIGTKPGNIRIRFVVSESGSAPACGPVTGEVEDYQLAIADNTAPVLHTSISPYLNPLTQTQTGNDGITINEIVYGGNPNNVLITEPDDAANQLYPRGIAITGYTGNGSWQYRIGDGSWTDFGAVSPTNALMLLGHGTVNIYDTITRIRFVPSGPGNAGISFQAWDGTVGAQGEYADASVSGGTTAFSVDAATGNIAVNNISSFTPNVFLAGSPNGSGGVYSSARLSNGTMLQSDLIGDGADGNAGYGIAFDQSTQRLFWPANSQTEIRSANADGSAQAVPVTTLGYITGLTVDGNYLYYVEWDASFLPRLVRVNKDGSGELQLSGGAGQLDMANDYYDIGGLAYRNGRLYMVVLSGTSGDYEIVSVDLNGENAVTHYSSPDYIMGIAVDDNNISWTESGSISVGVYTKTIGGGSPLLIASYPAGYSVFAVVSDGTYAYVAVSAEGTDVSSVKRYDIGTGDNEITMLTVPTQLSSFTFTGSHITLPVQLLEYEARLQSNETVKLTWKTSHELSNDRFELHRSANGVDFNPLASVPGVTNPGATNDYMYIDQRPATGNNYYRLLQFDIDGKMTVHGVRRVVVAEKIGKLSVYPNPVMSNELTVDLGRQPDATERWTITDLSGKSIKSGQLTSQRQQISLTGLNAGLYLLTLSSGETTSFIKK